MAAEAKAREARECLVQADKYLKTSLLKWRPDYDSAAHEYQRAATCFKAAKMMDKCLECHLNAANAFFENRQYFSAAKSFEQAALICGKEQNDWPKAIKYVEKACHLFREHGVPDTAALALDRGAKMIEAKCPEKAAEFYHQASEVIITENRPQQAAEYAGKAARINLKLKRLDAAVEMLDKQMTCYQEAEDHGCCGRLIVCLVLVQLSREDFVAAQKVFRDGRCYVEEQESYTLTDLLDAFDQMDTRKIVTVLNNPFIKSLDTEYAKLARNLQQKHGAGTVAESTPTHNLNNDDEESQPPEDDEVGAML